MSRDSAGDDQDQEMFLQETGQGSVRLLQWEQGGEFSNGDEISSNKILLQVDSLSTDFTPRFIAMDTTGHFSQGKEYYTVEWK